MAWVVSKATFVVFCCQDTGSLYSGVRSEAAGSTNPDGSQGHLETPELLPCTQAERAVVPAVKEGNQLCLNQSNALFP